VVLVPVPVADSAAVDLENQARAKTKRAQNQEIQPNALPMKQLEP
jgi:hypothetical protein